ncbi:MAG: DUF4252 domain-containing protein [Flavobacteriales bacterium]|nr:DUF4252 domain-containing protein [Flavobacteriales bacterium]
MNKQFYTVIGLFLMTFSTFAQNDIISSYFDEYEGREDITTVVLSSKAFEMVSQIDMEEAEMKEYQDMASHIESLRVIVDDNDQSGMQTAKAALNRLPPNFEELISVKEKDNQFKLLVDEENGVVRELVGIAGGENMFAIMSLTGTMRMSEVGKVTQQLMQASSTALEGLEGIENDIKVYPNPVEENGQLRVEFSDELSSSEVRIFNAAGQEVKSFRANEGINTIDISGLNKGVYMIKTDNDSKEVTGKFIIQ